MLYFTLYMFSAIIGYGLLLGCAYEFEVQLARTYPAVCWRETKFKSVRQWQLFAMIGFVPIVGLLSGIAIYTLSPPRGFRLRGLDERDFEFVPMPDWARRGDL